MAFRPSYGMSSYPHYPPQQQQIVFGQMRMPGSHPPPEPKTPQQTPAAVFVGNISEKCTDEFIQKILNECGEVASWKRIKGNNGILQAFGFCTFADLEGTLRALRILHEFHLGDKKLTVKAEEKVRNELRKTAIENRKKQGKKELRLKDGELPADDDDLKKDEEIRLKILHWMETDHKELLTVTEDGELSDETKKASAKEDVSAKQPSSSASSKKDEHRSRRQRSRSRSKGRSARRSRSKESPRAKKSRRSRSSSGSSSGSDSSSSRSSSYSSRSRSRSPQRSKNSSKRRGGGNHRSVSHSSEDSDDAREKRIMKQRMKEKEQAYHARLKRWEARERQMSKKYEKEERREKDRKKSLQKEHKRLKTFLEDYDDERDDPKFFKSSLFFQRKRDFEKEREADQKDRIQEQQEIEELKKEIMAEAENGLTINVDEEARKRHKLKEEEANRKMRADSGSPNPHQPLGQSANGANGESSSDEESGSEKTEAKTEVKDEPMEHSGPTKGPHTPPNEPPPLESAPIVVNGGGWKAIGDSKAVPNPQIARPTGNAGSSTLKKEASPIPIAQRLNGVFGTDDDEDDMHKRKKLKPFEITREERMQVMSVEEKKELTKQIIRKIPLTKEELFVHKIEWEQLDRQWMNDRIRPWVLKKISSFIGEEDSAFCDFICDQIEKKASPEKILKDVAVIIDEDAEQFVIKMWRLLIYEGQARRLGIT